MLTDLIYPPGCALCKQRLSSASHIICPSCHTLLFPIHAPYCNRCGATLLSIQDDCLACQGRTFHFNGTRVGFVFDDSIQRMIHALKYRHRPGIGYYLGEQLGKIVVRESWISHINKIVPIPLHKGRQRERGYNQSEFIARGLSSVTGIPIHTNSVIRTRHTRSQTTLTPEKRLVNVRDVFLVPNNQELNGCVVGLVDDVFTTGATLDSCSRVLLESGVSEVYALTIARA